MKLKVIVLNDLQVSKFTSNMPFQFFSPSISICSHFLLSSWIMDGFGIPDGPAWIPSPAHRLGLRSYSTVGCHRYEIRRYSNVSPVITFFTLLFNFRFASCCFFVVDCLFCVLFCWPDMCRYVRVYRWGSGRKRSRASSSWVRAK